MISLVYINQAGLNFSLAHDRESTKMNKGDTHAIEVVIRTIAQARKAELVPKERAIILRFATRQSERVRE